MPTKAGRKPLYRDDTDFLAAQLNLTHFQAQHRVQSAENLLPHTGFNGRRVPARFPLLGQVLTDAAADPKAVASLAKQFENLRAECAADMPKGRRPASWRRSWPRPPEPAMPRAPQAAQGPGQAP